MPSAPRRRQLTDNLISIAVYSHVEARRSGSGRDAERMRAPSSLLESAAWRAPPQRLITSRRFFRSSPKYGSALICSGPLPSVTPPRAFLSNEARYQKAALCETRGLRIGDLNSVNFNLEFQSPSLLSFLCSVSIEFSLNLFSLIRNLTWVSTSRRKNGRGNK